MNARPAPASYRDYRVYLSDMLEHLREQKSGFSFRSFSRKAGFASPNMLKLVIDGKRRVTRNSLPQFIKGLGLTKAEEKDFGSLVLLTEGETDEARDMAFKHLSRKPSTPTQELEDAQYELFSHWYAAPIRELADGLSFAEACASLGKRFRQTLPARSVERALELLLKTEMLVEDDQGVLRQAKPSWSSLSLLRRYAIRRFNKKVLELAKSALTELTTEERHISSLTLRLSPSQYQRLTRMIEEFAGEVLQATETRDEDQEAYFFSLALFPLTQGGDAKEPKS